jgi:hypothetical protein
MSVGNLADVKTGTLVPLTAGPLTQPLNTTQITPLPISMVGGICTSGTYRVYQVIMPSPQNQNNNYFKMYAIVIDNFSCSAAETTPSYPLPAPYVGTFGGVTPIAISVGTVSVIFNVPGGGATFSVSPGASLSNVNLGFILFGY